MRIFDRVSSGETVYLQDGSSPNELQVMWRRAANTFNRIVADEAAQFIYQSNSPDWSVKSGHFGILMPPFHKMWIEWTTPKFRYMGNRWHRMDPNRIAAKVTYSDDKFLIEAITSYDRGSRIGMFPIAQEVSNFGDLAFIDTKVIVMPEIRHLSDPRVPAGDYDSYAHGLALELWPALLAIGWLNCRNVSTLVARAPRSLRQKRIRKGRPVGLDYRRILLDDATASSLSSNTYNESDPKRLHIVRGHMRTYTADRPAFGTYVGNMWIHQHMRGDAGLGRVNHEYHVSRGSR